MTDFDSRNETGFRTELSQLVKKHISHGADPADIVDALSLQAEVARSKATDTAIDESPREDASLEPTIPEHTYGGSK